MNYIRLDWPEWQDIENINEIGIFCDEENCYFVKEDDLEKATKDSKHKTYFQWEKVEVWRSLEFRMTDEELKDFKELGKGDAIAFFNLQGPFHYSYDMETIKEIVVSTVTEGKRDIISRTSC